MLNKMNNEKVIDLVKKSTVEKSRRPRFIYAHFLMPHIPFYYDKNGHINDPETIVSQTAAGYTGYIPYVNSHIESMIAKIQHDNPSAVIILMGDHGFRSNTPREHWFKNLNAVYFPDKDYRVLYDSISCANQFRVIFNKLFKQSFPLVKDSSVYLTIREVFR
jgi:phosphoglycerol transferase MdoB-like AlkP superfamily enzyme